MLTEISTAYSLLKGATELTKGAIQYFKDKNDGEGRTQVAEIFNIIADLKMSLYEVQEKYEALEKENAQLQEALAIKGDVIALLTAYWLSVNTADGERRIDGPFCPACYDIKKQLIRLYYHSYASAGYVFKCGVHQDLSLAICKPNWPKEALMGLPG